MLKKALVLSAFVALALGFSIGQGEYTDSVAENSTTPILEISTEGTSLDLTQKPFSNTRDVTGGSEEVSADPTNEPSEEALEGPSQEPSSDPLQATDEVPTGEPMESYPTEQTSTEELPCTETKTSI